MTISDDVIQTSGLTRKARARIGRGARDRMPRRSHAAVPAAVARADPVDLLESQVAFRVPELVPIRYGRMLASPFTFYRGSALLMAADLGALPNSGLTAQLCGDAHVSNFGLFASPERRLVFDVNDFDETLPGPFEWDVKRLAASLEIAGRDVGLTAKQRRGLVFGAVERYRGAMHEFAAQTNLDVWYARAEIDQMISQFGNQLTTGGRKRLESLIVKSMSRDSRNAFAKLATIVDGEPRIAADPPVVVPVEDVFPEVGAQELTDELRGLLGDYITSLSPDRRHLVKQYRLVHVARKVVGVGSVGTRAWILLLEGSDSQDPLFLQAKQAEPSVLEAYAGTSAHPQHGERVVIGQRLMQASSDVFLGWQRATGRDGVSRDFYLRQLRDWKGSFAIEEMRPSGIAIYAKVCAWTLARAHARSGDRVAIGAYLGNSDVFAQAIADFAVSYADQNERDHAALAAAVAAGRVTAEFGI